MRRSSSTTSGVVSRTAGTTWLPTETSWTISKSSASASARRIAACISRWSSATSTRRVFKPAVLSSAPATRAVEACAVGRFDASPVRAMGDPCRQGLQAALIARSGLSSAPRCATSCMPTAARSRSSSGRAVASGSARSSLAAILDPLSVAFQVPLDPRWQIDIGWGIGIWSRWDGSWFVGIARDGYVDPEESAAFFPLYPLAVRGVAELIGRALRARRRPGLARRRRGRRPRAAPARHASPRARSRRQDGALPEPLSDVDLPARRLQRGALSAARDRDVPARAARTLPHRGARRGARAADALVRRRAATGAGAPRVAAEGGTRAGVRVRRARRARRRPLAALALGSARRSAALGPRPVVGAVEPRSLAARAARRDLARARGGLGEPAAAPRGG